MRKKIEMAMICICLALTCCLTYGITNYLRARYELPIEVVRTIDANSNKIDYQSVFDEFEDGKLETIGTKTTFEGTKTISLEELSFFDNLSESDVSECEGISVTYKFSYDNSTNVATMSAITQNDGYVIEVEEISGIVFTNEFGNVDVLFDIDGNQVLLSEMQDMGMVQNCGWFKNLFKKIVVATVAVVAVAAVTTVVVATCGAGLGACIAAGAIAGGVTGGTAGGIISYQETGKVEVWAVVGGIIGGATLGGLVGWGVGTLMGAGSTKMTCGFAKGSFADSETCINYHFNKHGAEVGAKTASEYVKLAEETAQKVVTEGVKPIRLVEGATPNVYRYEVGNYFIHMAKNASEIIIVSFGKLW